MEPTRHADSITVRRKFSVRIIWVWPYKWSGELNGGLRAFSVALYMKPESNLVACVTIKRGDIWELHK